MVTGAWFGKNMLEKRWVAVPPQAFTANGTVDGKITVADASLFKVKQIIILASSSKPSREDLEVKRITDINTIYVGPKGDINTRFDLSGYLVSDGAFIAANEQLRSKVPEQEVERLTYEEEPVVARRVILVDKLGNKIDDNNPLPVNASVSIGDIQVDLDFDPNDPDGPNSSNTGAYIRDSEGNLITSTSSGLKQELDVSDEGTHSALATIQSTLNSIDAGIPVALGPNTAINSMPITIALDQSPIPVTATVTFPDEPLKISGTQNGLPNGTEYGFVNNLRLQILDSHDRQADFTYADFGTKNQRVTVIDYTSATFPGATIRRQFTYTLIGNNYRRDNETWTIV